MEFVYQEWDIMREISTAKETRLDKNLYTKRNNGNWLQEERLRRRMSIDDLASMLKESVEDMQAFERNQKPMSTTVWNWMNDERTQ